nr:hypothetical protein [Tanacetum cinerariifolium]
MNQFYEMKGIMRQYSVVITPQQNGVAKRRNRTLIEAARTTLADSKLPTTFWAKSVLLAMYKIECTKACDDAGKARMEIVDEDPRQKSKCKDQEKECNVNNTNNVNAAGTNKVNVIGANTNNELLFDPEMPALEDINTCNFLSDHEDDDEEADVNNTDTTIQVCPAPSIRIHKDHSLNKVIGDLHLTTQTRHMSNNLEEHGFFTSIHQRTNHKDLQNYLFACFLSQEEPKKNKKDERGIVIRNKARLVAQGHTQEERIDYDEVFAPVARIEAIRLFLAYAYFKDFVVSQMDVKSAFLYGKIKEEVYIFHPPRFEDPDFPDKVYKVEKASYILHQAPKAWYETLSTYLLDNGFHRGKIDKTLFIRRHKDDILLCQVYVDDIIFGSTKKELCNAFEKMIHEKFQMSSIGELTFFLGLQVKQKQDGIFISQDKYVAEILKKYSFSEVKNASTPIETQKPLLKDEDVCAYARCQVNLKVSHLHDVKRIFRYLKGQPKFGLWYPKDSPFNLVAYTDSDYARASLDRKSTTGAIWATVKAKTINGEGQLQALVDGKKILKTESTIRRDLQLKDAEGVDCLPNVVIFKQLTLMSIYVTPSYTKKIFRNMKRVGKGFSRRETPLFLTMMVQAQEKMGEGLANPTDPHHTPTIIQPFTSQPQKTKQHRKPRRKVTDVPQPSDPTSVADEAVNEEMDDSLERVATTATSLDIEQDRESKEATKTTQSVDIDILKKRVKKLERKKRSRTHGLKRLYKVGLSARVESFKDEGLGKEDASKQGRIADIDANKDIYLVSVHNDEDMFGVNDLDGDEVIVKSQGQGKSLKKLSKKDQLMLDEELAFKLQAEEEERIAREKAQQIKEVNIAWDDKRRKFFAAKKAKEKRNRPLTRAQQRSIMCTYLKNMERWELKSLKKKSFAEIQELFDKAIKKVNTFFDFRTELVEEILKKAEAEITQEDDGDDVTNDATPLSSKSPTIVNYKIYKEGKKNYFQIFRADGDGDGGGVDDGEAGDGEVLIGGGVHRLWRPEVSPEMGDDAGKQKGENGDEVMGDDEVMEMVVGMTMVRWEMVRWRRLEVVCIGCGGQKSRRRLKTALENKKERSGRL